MSGDKVILRTYDLVVFGASGFTGRFVVEELARVIHFEETTLKWAISGRNEDKLKSVLVESSKQIGRNLNDVAILIADIADEDSLHQVAKRTKVVVNCAGPFRDLGEPMVRACVENGTHHIDISTEPFYLEKIQLTYHSKAVENKCYVIGACGFGSIPSEMGNNLVQNEFQGDLNSIDVYVQHDIGSAGCSANVGHMNSVMVGFANAAELNAQREQLFPKPLPKTRHPLLPRAVLFHSDDTKSWCVPLPTPDKSVAQRTQRFNYEHRHTRPVQVDTHLQRPSFFRAFLTLVGAAVFGSLTNYQWTQSWLRNFPALFSFGVFSNSGPSREQIKSCGFTMTFVGRGYKTRLASPEHQHPEPPNKTIVVQLKAPEPAYESGPTCVVQASLVLLQEMDKLPNEGGVYTPGSAFADTSLTDRLSKHGFHFRVLKK